MNYIFLDIDGVLTSTLETPGSYINHSPAEYGISASCIERLIKLADACNAKVVISSNWRRFPDDGVWVHSKEKQLKNPLPGLKKKLGSRYVGDLTHERHLTKSEALELWFEDSDIDWKECHFVVFDDDLREGFQDTFDYGIYKKFILTNPQLGLTSQNINKAMEILEDQNRV